MQKSIVCHRRQESAPDDRRFNDVLRKNDCAIKIDKEGGGRIFFISILMIRNRKVKLEGKTCSASLLGQVFSGMHSQLKRSPNPTGPRMLQFLSRELGFQAKLEAKLPDDFNGRSSFLHTTVSGQRLEALAVPGAARGMNCIQLEQSSLFHTDTMYRMAVNHGEVTVLCTKATDYYRSSHQKIPLQI